MRYRFIVIFLGLLLILFETASADDFQILPSVSLRQEYNTNVFFTAIDEKADFITTVIPGVDVTNRTERMTLNLFGRVKPRFYWSNSELNDVDQDYRGRISYRASPITKVNGDLGFRVDNRPDRDLDTTGLSTRGTRYSSHAGFGANHAFNEITTGSASYAFDHDDWTGPGNGEDYTGQTVNLGATHNLDRWAPRVAGQMNLGFGNYEYETSETWSFFTTAGASYRLFQVLNLQASLGARYVDSTFDTIDRSPAGDLRIVEESNTGWGGIGRASLRYSGLRTNAGIMVSHDLRIGGSRRGPSALTRVGCNIDYRFLEKMTAGISAGFFKNRADAGDFSAFETNENTYNIGPRFRWQLFRHVTLEGAYTYRYNDDKTVDRDREQQLVYMQLTIGYPLTELFDILSETGDIGPAGGYPWPK